MRVEPDRMPNDYIDPNFVFSARPTKQATGNQEGDV